MAFVCVRQHLKQMHGEGAQKKQLHTCPVCSYQGRDLANFIYHMMVKHNDTSHGTVKIHQCHHCEYKSYHKRTMRNHIARVHGTYDIRSDEIETL